MTTLTISGDQGWTRTDINNAGGAHATVDVIDATAASWSTRSTGSPQQEYPIRIRTLPLAVELRGGTINGLFDLEMDWGFLYGEGNAASIFMEDCQSGCVITGVRIDRVWDAVRIIRTPDWTFKDSWVTRTRDDVLEADNGLNGVVRNVLAEDVFMGFSFGNANTPASSLNNTVLLENNLVKLGLYYDDEPNTHGSPIKMAVNSPKLVLHNNVFAIQRVDHSNFPRLEIAFAHTQPESSGNYYLNLTDNPLPGDYPTIPPSFTYLSGQTARDFWDAARAAWTGEPEPEPDPETTPGIVNVVSINPTSGAVSMMTDEAYSGTVTVGVTNSEGSDDETLSITVA